MSIFSINIKQPKTGKRRLPTTRTRSGEVVENPRRPTRSEGAVGYAAYPQQEEPRSCDVVFTRLGLVAEVRVCRSDGRVVQTTSQLRSSDIFFGHVYLRLSRSAWAALHRRGLSTTSPHSMFLCKFFGIFFLAICYLPYDFCKFAYPQRLTAKIERSSRQKDWLRLLLFLPPKASSSDSRSCDYVGNRPAIPFGTESS